MSCGRSRPSSSSRARQPEGGAQVGQDPVRVTGAGRAGRRPPRASPSGPAPAVRARSPGRPAGSRSGGTTPAPGRPHQPALHGAPAVRVHRSPRRCRRPRTARSPTAADRGTGRAASTCRRVVVRRVRRGRVPAGCRTVQPSNGTRCTGTSPRPAHAATASARPRVHQHAPPVPGGAATAPSRLLQAALRARDAHDARVAAPRRRAARGRPP